MTKYLSVKDFIVATDGSLSRNSVYQAISNGELPHVRIGRKLLIPEDALDKLLSSQHEEAK